VSLTARLFLAIAVVSGAALLLGVWLVQRALHVEIQENVTLTPGMDGAAHERQYVPNYHGLSLVPTQVVVPQVVVVLVTEIE
jgi:hypothetical protein